MVIYSNTGTILKILNFRREQLSENTAKNIHNMVFDFEDIDSENRELANYLYRYPEMVIPLVI